MASGEREIAHIEALWQRGYIREQTQIDFLAEKLHHPQENIRQLAAQTIIEEVLGRENKELRLQALKTLKPWLRQDRTDTCFGQIDLHTHDFFSEDGYFTPTALILEAYRKGLSGLAVISHNQRYEDDEAEQAAHILGLDLFKGGELVSFVRLSNGRLENVHILQLYMESPPPEKLNQILRLYIVKYAERLKSLGWSDMEKAYAQPLEALNFLRVASARRLVEERLRHLRERYGDRFCLEAGELLEARRGEEVYPFTIAVALWRKYGEVFRQGFSVREGGEERWVTLKSINEVYQFFIRENRRNQGQYEDEPGPDLESIATRALLLNRRLIIPHPNEFSQEALERLLTELACVKWKGKRYAGILVGIEYYSNKLRGDYRDYIRNYIDRLNRTHPVYRNFPLLLLPGSDCHGKYSPDCPLGLGENYPADRSGYRETVYQALHRPIVELPPL